MKNNHPAHIISTPGRPLGSSTSTVWEQEEEQAFVWPRGEALCSQPAPAWGTASISSPNVPPAHTPWRTHCWFWHSQILPCWEKSHLPVHPVPWGFLLPLTFVWSQPWVPKNNCVSTTTAQQDTPLGHLKNQNMASASTCSSITTHGTTAPSYHLSILCWSRLQTTFCRALSAWALLAFTE